MCAQANSPLERTFPTTAVLDTTTVSSDPRSEYAARLAARRSAHEAHSRADSLLATTRGLVFFVGLSLFYFVFSTGNLSTWWLLAPVLIFLMLVIRHSVVVRQLTRADAAIRFYTESIARLEDRWAEQGATGERYVDESHLYSHDLDVFGPGSLFQLISRARTRLGEDTLAKWLAEPAEPNALKERQAAVDELRFHLDLREDFAVLDAEVHDGLDQNHLVHWSQQPARPLSALRRFLAVVLGIAAIVSLTAWLFGAVALWPLLVVLIGEVLFAYANRRHVRELARSVDQAGSGLAVLSQVLELIERQKFDTPYLSGLNAALDTHGMSPSAQIARLRALIEYLNNCLKNQFFAIPAFLLCLPTHFVHSIETWRDQVGPRIPRWLQAVGEIESLSSLAGYAYEHPGDPFPEIVTDGTTFEAEALGHPLLPENQCVRNDLAFDQSLKMFMVSGSNMSGKSTLLRSVGTNVVLALAGAPVRCETLRVSPLSIGTAMRVHDSLQQGMSLFYMAVSRMKAVVEMTKESPPLLFLVDEILQGTNSHDRRIGAEGIIRQLISGNAIGLVTTHDLALTEIVASLGAQARNVHFEDRLVDGRMTFDFRICPGVVQRSNALELMRMMGLEVDN